MALCECKYLFPQCEYHHCRARADLSVMVPLSWKPPLRLAPKFFCVSCFDYFKTAWGTPIRGIDRPENAPDDWRPSLLECIRHAQIAINFEDRRR
jgi:hypothetical protein